MNKSNCCGAEASRNFGESDDLHCLKCLRKCRAIPDDIMSRKEILEFCEKWTEGVLYIDFIFFQVCSYLMGCKIASQGSKDFLKDLQRVLESVKEHLK